jgi:hypothetical protein
MGKQEKNTMSIDLSEVSYMTYLWTQSFHLHIKDEFTNNTFQAKLFIIKLVISLLTYGYTTSVW